MHAVGRDQDGTDGAPGQDADISRGCKQARDNYGASGAEELVDTCLIIIPAESAAPRRER